MRTRETRWLFTIMVPTLMAMLYSGSADVQAAAPRGVFKTAMHYNLSADWLDPATGSSGGASYVMLYIFHDALLKPMSDGLYSPCLAESWTISPDSKVYEFKIRKGVKFHNGDTLTTEDVVFSFWRYKSVQAKFIHDRTEKLEAVNRYLIRIHFKEPFPDFLDYLLPGATSIAWVVPKKYVEKVGDAGFKKHPIGAGPYKFVEFSPGVRLVGEAFEDFWRKVPKVNRMEFYPITEIVTRYAMLKRGEVDQASSMVDVFYKKVKEDPSLRVFISNAPSTWLVHMASQFDPKSPWFDARVRKAASLAIDRNAFSDIHFPGSVPLGSLGMPGEPGNLERPPDPYDPEQAKNLLTEAGYPKGFHGGTFYPYDGGFGAMGEMIANYWKAIGITVDIKLLDRAAFIAARRSGTMKGTSFMEASSPPTIGARLSYLFGAASYGNYPDILALWDQYNRAIDAQIRQDLITRIQRLICDKTMYIFTTHSSTPSAFGPKLKGNPYKIQQPSRWWFVSPMEDLEIMER